MFLKADIPRLKIFGAQAHAHLALGPTKERGRRVNRLRAVQRLHDEIFAKCAGLSPVRDLMVQKNGGVRIELRTEEHVSMFLKADIPTSPTSD